MFFALQVFGHPVGSFLTIKSMVRKPWTFFFFSIRRLACISTAHISGTASPTRSSLEHLIPPSSQIFSLRSQRDRDQGRLGINPANSIKLAPSTDVFCDEIVKFTRCIYKKHAPRSFCKFPIVDTRSLLYPISSFYKRHTCARYAIVSNCWFCRIMLFSLNF